MKNFIILMILLTISVSTFGQQNDTISPRNVMGPPNFILKDSFQLALESSIDSLNDSIWEDIFVKFNEQYPKTQYSPIRGSFRVNDLILWLEKNYNPPYKKD